MMRAWTIGLTVTCLFWLTGCAEPSTDSKDSVREAQGAPTQMENKEHLDVRRQQSGAPGVIR
jgi:hypothetical protein